MNRRRKDVLDDAVLISSSERFFIVCIILNVSGYLNLLLLSKGFNYCVFKNKRKENDLEIFFLILCMVINENKKKIKLSFWVFWVSFGICREQSKNDFSSVFFLGFSSFCLQDANTWFLQSLIKNLKQNLKDSVSKRHSLFKKWTLSLC